MIQDKQDYGFDIKEHIEMFGKLDKLLNGNPIKVIPKVDNKKNVESCKVIEEMINEECYKEQYNLLKYGTTDPERIKEADEKRKDFINNNSYYDTR